MGNARTRGVILSEAKDLSIGKRFFAALRMTAGPFRLFIYRLFTFRLFIFRLFRFPPLPVDAMRLGRLR